MTIGLLKKNTIVELLKEDHERFRALFSKFESGDEESKQQVATEFMRLIAIHDQVEKKILYPVASELSSEAEEIVLRSKEAHHVVNFLILELKTMPFGPRFNAKFSKLAEGVRAHMTEEEDELFPLIEASDMDLKWLGKQMIELKERLKTGGMIARVANGGVGKLVTAAIIGGLGYLAYRSRKKFDIDMDDVKEAVGVGQSRRGRRH